MAARTSTHNVRINILSALIWWAEVRSWRKPMAWVNSAEKKNSNICNKVAWYEPRDNFAKSCFVPALVIMSFSSSQKECINGRDNWHIPWKILVEVCSANKRHE